MLFNCFIHSVVVFATCIVRGTSPPLYNYIYYSVSAVESNVIHSGHTHFICRSVAPVLSPQSWFCQLYQVIVCCHGDRNGAGSGLDFLERERERRAGRQFSSMCTCREDAQWDTGKTNELAKQYNGCRDDKPLPLPSFLFTPERISSSHCTASSGKTQRKLEMILVWISVTQGKPHYADWECKYHLPLYSCSWLRFVSPPKISGPSAATLPPFSSYLLKVSVCQQCCPYTALFINTENPVT